MSHLRNLRIINLLIALIILLSFSRCTQDEYDLDKLSDEMEINMGLLTPLAYGSLSLNDIISEFDSTSYIDTDQEGLLYITYEDSLLSLHAEDLLDVPDQDFFEYFIESDVDVPPYINWGDSIVIEREELFTFDFNNNEQLDSIILETANLTIDINSSFRHDGKVILSSPNIKDQQGEPFVDTIMISDASGNFSFTDIISLNNHVIELTTLSDSSYIPFNFKLTLYNSGAGISSGDQVEIAATLSDISFESVFGYLGNYDLISETGDIDLSFFESLNDGYIRFENPQVNFKISNSFGVPAAVDIERFTGFNQDGDSTTLLFNPGVNPFSYAYPTIEEINQTKDTVLSINGNNSTIADFLAFLPTHLEYSLKASSNPDGEQQSDYNFATKDSKINVDLEFILPLWFRANNIALQDTIDMDLSDISEETDMIDKINIVLKVINGLPVAIDFQLYFLDESYQPVDTLFNPGSQPVIAAGQLDSEYKVSSPTQKVSVVEYLQQDIENLEDVRYAYIKAGLKTAEFDNDISVKFFDYYNVDFNLSIDVDALINTNDL